MKKIIMKILTWILVLIPFSDLAKAAEVGVKIERIEVKDDQGPLVAIVELMPPNQGAHGEFIGETGPDGVLELAPAILCPPRHRLSFRSNAGPYLPTIEECAKSKTPIRITLSSWSAVAKLAKSFEAAQTTGQRGTAALVANELAYRLSVVTLDELQVQQKLAAQMGEAATAQALEVEILARSETTAPASASGWSARAYGMAGAALSITNPTMFDARQGRRVMSPALSQALTGFQRAQGIESTGRLDYPTARALSGSHVGPFLTNPM